MARIIINDLSPDMALSKDEMKRIRGGLSVSRKQSVFSWLPEVGDEVLISFLPGDARTPIVLGNLWGSKDPPAEKDSDT